MQCIEIHLQKHLIKHRNPTNWFAKLNCKKQKCNWWTASHYLRKILLYLKQHNKWNKKKRLNTNWLNTDIKDQRNRCTQPCRIKNTIPYALRWRFCFLQRATECLHAIWFNAIVLIFALYACEEKKCTSSFHYAHIDYIDDLPFFDLTSHIHKEQAHSNKIFGHTSSTILLQIICFFF